MVLCIRHFCSSVVHCSQAPSRERPACKMDLGRIAPARRSPHLRQILKSMLEDSRALLENSLLNDILSRIPGITRQEFKDDSNTGFVWERRRHVDKGKYMYGLLYEFLAHQAASDHVLGSLAKRWPSLCMDHSFPGTSLEMRADVIEFILADCRYLGEAVPSRCFRASHGMRTGVRRLVRDRRGVAALRGCRRRRRVRQRR